MQNIKKNKLKTKNERFLAGIRMGVSGYSNNKACNMETERVCGSNSQGHRTPF